MSDDCPTCESMSLEEATVSNMWEIAAIVEALELKGLCTKKDLYEIDGKVALCLTVGQGSFAPCPSE
jgi:hypothetical protein